MVKKIAAALTGVLMVLTGVLIAPLSGWAIDVGTAPPSLVDYEKHVSLTIHKYLGGPKEDQPNNGTEITDTSQLGDPIEGVKFTAYKVDGIDLSTNEGWQTAKAFLGKQTASRNEITAKKIIIDDQEYTLTEDKSGTTNAEGSLKLTFSVSDEAEEEEEGEDSAAGLYLVVEDLQSSSDLKAKGSPLTKETVTPASPFFVALPMTDPSNQNQWLYDVHVYPKNQSDTITKQVDDSAAFGPEAGSKTLKYFLSGTVTDVGDRNGDGEYNGSDLGYWMIQDQLSPDYLDMGSVKVTVKLGDTYGTAKTQLLPDTDFVVKTDASTGMVSVALTSAGLEKAVTAVKASAQTKIFVDLEVKLKSGSEGLDSKKLTNTAYLIPNNSWVSEGSMPPTSSNDFTPPTPVTPSNPDESDPNKPGIPSNEVSSKYGKIVLKKVSPDGTQLTGAEFTLFQAHWDDSSQRYDCTSDYYYFDDKTKVATSKPVEDQDGLYTIDNVLLSTSYTVIKNDGTRDETKSDQDRPYCLVETKAPDGYELLAEPILFSLKTGAQTVDITDVAGKLTTDTAVSDNGLLVVNLPANLGNRLPLTGAQGILFAAIAGGLLLIGGVLLAVRNRKSTQRD